MSQYFAFFKMRHNNEYQLDELSKMCSPDLFDDGGIELYWNGDYFLFRFEYYN